MLEICVTIVETADLILVVQMILMFCLNKQKYLISRNKLIPHLLNYVQTHIEDLLNYVQSHIEDLL